MYSTEPSDKKQFSEKFDRLYGVKLDYLRQQGIFTLDVPANQLSVAVINRHLELKAKTML